MAKPKIKTNNCVPGYFLVVVVEVFCLFGVLFFLFLLFGFGLFFVGGFFKQSQFKIYRISTICK